MKLLILISFFSVLSFADDRCGVKRAESIYSKAKEMKDKGLMSKIDFLKSVRHKLEAEICLDSADKQSVCEQIMDIQTQIYNYHYRKFNVDKAIFESEKLKLIQKNCKN